MMMMRRTNLEMGSLSFNTQTNHGIMGDHHGHGHGGSNNFRQYSDDISSSESSDLTEDGTLSSGCSSPRSPAAKVENGALGDMSSLLQQLPIKRGLSKYFNGKSQSYNSLSNVTCLEDLAKPENPYTKKLKSCKSYMCFSEATSSSSSRSPPRLKSASSNSKLISKKSSRRINGGGGGGGGSFIKPPTHPTPPHRSSSTSSFNNGTPMFA